MANTRTCPNPDCGKKTRTTGPFCPYCTTELTPDTAPVDIPEDTDLPEDEEETDNQEEVQDAEYESVDDDDEDEGGKNMSKFWKFFWWIVGIIAIIIIIILLCRGCSGPSPKVKTTATVSPTTLITPMKLDGTSTLAPIATSNVGPVVNNGINYGSKCMITINAGDIVSGDIEVIANDNSRKPLYDNDPTTADVVTFKKGTLIWSEWGCFVVRQGSQSEIDNLIQDKKNQSYTVRNFSWPSDLSTNTPTK